MVAVAVLDRGDAPTGGLVLVERDQHPIERRPYATLRWGMEGGSAALYSGHYDLDYGAAAGDLQERAGWRAT